MDPSKRSRPVGGNHDGYYRTGRYLRNAGGGGDTPQNQVLATLINGSGCPTMDHFGDPQYGGELTSLRA